MGAKSKKYEITVKGSAIVISDEQQQPVVRIPDLNQIAELFSAALKSLLWQGNYKQVVELMIAGFTTNPSERLGMALRELESGLLRVRAMLRRPEPIDTEICTALKEVRGKLTECRNTIAEFSSSLDSVHVIRRAVNTLEQECRNLERQRGQNVYPQSLDNLQGLGFRFLGRSPNPVSESSEIYSAGLRAISAEVAQALTTLTKVYTSVISTQGPCCTALATAQNTVARVEELAGQRKGNDTGAK